MRLLLSVLILAVLGLYSVGQNSVAKADDDEDYELDWDEPINGAFFIFVEGEPANSPLRFMINFSPATEKFGSVEIAQQTALKSDSKGHYWRVAGHHDDDDDMRHYEVEDHMHIFDPTTFAIIGIEVHQFTVHYDEDSDSWTGTALIETFDLDGNSTSSVTVDLIGERLPGIPQ